MKIYCDSSTREACIVIEGQDPIIVPYPEKVTNNVGEYRAVILALEEARRPKLEQVELLTDSLLVANQVSGIWKCRQPHLKALLAQVRILLMETPNFVTWIPREENLAGKILG